MTGGQVAPTTEHGEKTLTTPYGNPSQGIDICNVVKHAGASHVSRWTTYHMDDLIKEIEKAIDTRGLSFIEVLSQCPTRTGKKEGLSGVEMLEWYKDNTTRDKEGEGIYVGELQYTERPELTEEIYKQILEKGGEPL